MIYSPTSITRPAGSATETTRARLQGSLLGVTTTTNPVTENNPALPKLPKATSQRENHSTICLLLFLFMYHLL